MLMRFNTTMSSRKGLSLLEVILSIAILGLSMVAIGHLFNLGFRSAADVQLRSEANMIAETTMAEISAGIIDLSSGGGLAEGSPRWQYEINSQESRQPGLLSVTVRVSLANDPGNNNVSVSLVRFLVDPSFEPEQPTASGSSSSGSGSSRSNSSRSNSSRSSSSRSSSSRSSSSRSSSSGASSSGANSSGSGSTNGSGTSN